MRKKDLQRGIFAPRCNGRVPEGVPPPRVFLEKSLDLLDSKGVDYFGSDKEFVRVSNEEV